MGDRTYTASAFRVELRCPCFHDKGIINGHDKYLAGGGEPGRVEVAWDVGVGASWAYGRWISGVI